MWVGYVLMSGISAAEIHGRPEAGITWSLLFCILGSLKSRLFSSGTSCVGCFRVAWEWLPFVQSNLGLQL